MVYGNEWNFKAYKESNANLFEKGTQIAFVLCGLASDLFRKSGWLRNSNGIATSEKPEKVVYFHVRLTLVGCRDEARKRYANVFFFRAFVFALNLTESRKQTAMKSECCAERCLGGDSLLELTEILGFEKQRAWSERSSGSVEGLKVKVINVVQQRRIVNSKVWTELELEFRIGRECVVFVFTVMTVGSGAAGLVYVNVWWICGKILA